MEQQIRVVGGAMAGAVVDSNVDPEAVVTTTLGNIRQADLRVVVGQQQETKDVWVWARECFYIGTEFPEAVETIVRRDVWVTMKHGQGASAEAAKFA